MCLEYLQGSVEEFHVKMVRRILWDAISSREAWSLFASRQTSHGKAELGELSFEAAQKFIWGDEFAISMGQNFKFRLLTNMMEMSETLLSARNWSVVPAADDAPDIICSDNPLTLQWAEPVAQALAPALGMRRTIAMFPLSRRLALCGVFECFATAAVLSAKDVGVLNAHTALHAKRFVFSGSETSLRAVDSPTSEGAPPGTELR